MLSGYCFTIDGESIKLIVKRRAYRLLVPCFFSTVSVLYLSFTSDWKIQSLLWNLPVALWFLPIMFLVNITFALIVKITKDALELLIICLSVLFIGYVLNFFEINLPHSLSVFPLSFALFGIGFICKQWNVSDVQLERKAIMYVLSSLIILPLLLYYCENSQALSLVSNKFDIFQVTSSVYMIVAMVGVSSKITIHWVSNVLLWLCQNSILILGLHFVFVYVSIDYIQPCVGNHIIFKVVQFVFIWMALFGASVLLKKMPFLIGQ